MPFADELVGGVAVVPYDRSWPDEFIALGVRIRDALGGAAIGIDHIGSTSVPGLAAKDCIDVQVRVDALDDVLVTQTFASIGFRLRPEPWNRAEALNGSDWPKLVFAPPVGERASNVHVRETGSPVARQNLLFRDYLSANADARDVWGEFKRALSGITDDIYAYGQAKAGPTKILMLAAEQWATDTGWDCSPVGQR